MRHLRHRREAPGGALAAPQRFGAAHSLFRHHQAVVAQQVGHVQVVGRQRAARRAGCARSAAGCGRSAPSRAAPSASTSSAAQHGRHRPRLRRVEIEAAHHLQLAVRQPSPRGPSGSPGGAPLRQRLLVGARLRAEGDAAVAVVRRPDRALAGARRCPSGAGSSSSSRGPRRGSSCCALPARRLASWASSACRIAARCGSMPNTGSSASMLPTSLPWVS